MTKRLFDAVAAGAGLALLSPVLLGIALAVRTHDGGPVLYRARRVGKDGQEFRLLKFRTMTPNADGTGPAVTRQGDVRVTRLGRFLRRTKLDELPQLLNVLQGDMSLVGPRPEDPRYVALYTPEQRQVLSVRPGITSAASLEYRHEEQLISGPDAERTYLEHVLPDKLAIDLAYVRNRSFWSDLQLIARTVRVMAEEVLGHRPRRR